MASYASPPLSPTHWAQNPHRSLWNSLLGDYQRTKQQKQMMARSGNGSHATDRLEAPRGDPTGMPQVDQAMFRDYELSRAYESRQAPGQGQSQRREQFVPYIPAMLDGLRGPFVAEPQYLSAAIETLSNTFAVPQYSVPEDAAAGVRGLLPCMSTGVPYNQPGPMPHSSTSQSISAMSEFSPIGHGRLGPPLGQDDCLRQDLTKQLVDETFSQYQQALRGTFHQTRAGRLVEASRSLLEISEWLVDNAWELGLLRDDPLQYDHHLQLWTHFNQCWLAVCQKQKGMTQDLVLTGHQPVQTSLLCRDSLEEMGKNLIQLCDQLEEHGLVDYQMGIWEEEILCVLSQCLDLIESTKTRIPSQEAIVSHSSGLESPTEPGIGFLVRGLFGRAYNEQL